MNSSHKYIWVVFSPFLCFLSFRVVTNKSHQIQLGSLGSTVRSLTGFWGNRKLLYVVFRAKMCMVAANVLNIETHCDNYLKFQFYHPEMPQLWHCDEYIVFVFNIKLFKVFFGNLLCNFDTHSYMLTADKCAEFGKRLFLGKDQRREIGNR